MLGRLRYPSSFSRLRLLLGCGLLTALTFAWPTSAHLRHSAPKPQDSLTLEPGQPIEQELKGGETHRYAVALAAAQYFRICLESSTVSLKLFAPDDRLLSHKSGDHLFVNQSRIEQIAESSGIYRLELNQISPRVDGYFVLGLEEVRLQLPADVLRLKARNLMDEVEALNPLAQPQQISQQSQSKLTTALSYWRASNDRLGEADGEYLIGAIDWQSGEHQEAASHLLTALTLYRQIGARQEQASVLYDLGRLYRKTNELSKAFDHFRQALELRRQLNRTHTIADTLLTMGRLHQHVGELTVALELYHEAAQLLRAGTHRRSLATALENLGEIYLALGEPRRGLDYYQEAIDLRVSAGSGKGQAVALIEIGKAYFQLEDYQRARDQLEQAVALLQEQGNTFNQVNALIWLGRTYLALQEPRQALTALHRAETANNFRPHQPYDMAAAFNYRCEAHLRLSEFELARAACLQSLSLSEQAAYLPYSSITHGLLAELAHQRGALGQAREHYEKALALVESLRSKLALSAQRAAFLGGKYQLFTAYTAFLLKLHRQHPQAGHDQSAFHIVERARARSLLEALIESRTQIRQSAEPLLLEQENNLLRQLDSLAAAQAFFTASHQSAPSVVLERTQTRRDLQTAYEQLQGQIRQRTPRYAALTQPQPLTATAIQKQVVTDPGTLLLAYALGEEQSFLFTITGDTFNYYELPKRAVIEPATTRFYELLTARNRPVKFEEDAARAARLRQADQELTDAGVKLSELILKPAAAELKNRHLLIVADGALQMIPFAALPEPGAREQGLEARAKRQSLAPSPQPLIVKHAITYLPSASVLGVLRNELKDRKPAPKTLAVFADPVFDADDPRVPAAVRDRLARERQTTAPDKAAEPAAFAAELTRALKDIGLDGARSGLAALPYTRAEAEQILKLAPAGQTFSALGFDATQEAALKAELSQYRYLHFATHGLLDNTNPELSGLVLSLLDAQGRPLDGHLRMVEILNMNLPAELVVLSACKTGLGKDVRGEGLMSLTRGFMYAGAKRVMVSLWDVNDKSTASLMGEFYRGLLAQKQSPAQALRTAQLWMLKQPQWRSPYYWAAFVQHGEPR